MVRSEGEAVQDSTGSIQGLGEGQVSKVWVLLISHECGDSVNVRLSEEGCWEILTEWALTWFKEEFPDLEMPENDDAVREMYWNLQRELGEEYYFMDECEVRP